MELLQQNNGNDEMLTWDLLPRLGKLRSGVSFHMQKREAEPIEARLGFTW